MKHLLYAAYLVTIAIFDPLAGSLCSFMLMGWIWWSWRTGRAPAEDGGSHREERGLSDA